MNKKASKNSLQLPLGLNLADNNLHIDSEWSTFEHCNAPYINNMYMPLYKTVADRDGATAYDAEGNMYHYVDGALYKNDTVLFNAVNRKFLKTKLSDLSEYLSWDAGSWLKFNDSTNTIECSNGYVSEPLFDNGSIIASRIRNIDNHIYALVYYINDLGEQKALVLVDTVRYNPSIVWYKQLPRLRANVAYSPTAVSGVYSSPLIQITVLDNAPVFTMISKYGTVMASDDVYFTNLIVYNNNVWTTNNIRPANQTFSGEVTETIIGTFSVTNTQAQTTGNTIAYRKLIDGQYVYYKNENGAYVEILPPATQIWTETGNTVTIGGETFDEVTTQTKEYSFTTQVVNTSNNVSTFDIKVTDSEGDTTVSTTTGTAIVTRLVTKYSSEPEYQYSISAIEMMWNNVESNIPSTYWNGAVYSDSRTTTTEQTNLTYSVAPNIFLDDGTMYSLYGFNVTTSNWDTYAITAGLTIVDSARFDSWSVVDGNLTYAFTATEFTSVDSTARAIVSNSFTVGQNFFANTTKMARGGNTPSTAASSGVTDTNKFLEWTNSNCNAKKYWPGTTPYTDKNYNGLTGWEDGQMVFTIQGYRSSIGKWNLLYNTRESGNSMLNGISYSNTVDEAGTLLTEWQSVDPSFYISATDDYFVYRDNNKQYWKIEIVEDAVDIIAILSNRLILLNTLSYYNAYDTVLGLPLHAFTDFNNRVLYGSDTPTIKSGAADVVRTAEAINNLYSIEPRNLMSSSNEGVVSRYRVEIGEPTVYRYVCPESAFIQPIDIFYQSTTAVAANYQFSIIPERVQTRTITTSLIGTVYQVRVGQLSPSLWVKIVDGTGNTDVALEGRNAYPLVYDVDTPVFLYDVSSTLTNVDAMFILQGQYYAVINNKIYSLIYSNGAIAEMDAIVEVRGFTYVGSTTSIAFFYSERMRAFYSFTGDANLQHIFDASKISKIYTFLNGSSYIYDESTQSIYIPTDIGLLVFGPKNTYLLEDILRPSMIYFTDDTLWHVITDDSIVTFSYYYREGFTSNKVILETEFFGIGDTESTSVDKWNIKLYTQTGRADDVKLSVRSITDITTKSEDKILPVAVNAWDKWSKAVLLSYAPAIIKGAGIRIRIETDNAVESITPHIMDNNTGTLTRRQA